MLIEDRYAKFDQEATERVSAYVWPRVRIMGDR